MVIIGSGFGGLSSACLLAKAGAKVTVLEKNDQLGGRAGLYEEKGFRFDMGPSWYLMPDIFEQFFQLMGTSAEKELDLRKLSPSYRVYFDDDPEPVDVEASIEAAVALVERYEEGAGEKLREYLDRSKEQYDIAKDRFIYKNYNSIFDFFTLEVARAGMKMSVFSNMDRYVRRWFRSDRIQKLLQYPLVFLGNSPYNAPALYNIMSYIDFAMGVYYPMGGIYEIVRVLEKLGRAHGADYQLNTEVVHIEIEDGMTTGVRLSDGSVIPADIVVNNADPAFTDLHLLDAKHRVHSERYWDTRVLAPSALLLYLGVDREVPNLQHHTLYFSKDWKQNFDEIFDHPKWPEDPSLYVCAPSKTDASVAPAGKENLLVLVPIAPDLPMTQDERRVYEDRVIDAIGEKVGMKDLRQHLEVRHSLCVEEFASRYNSYKGTALGLAHTLRQTAIFRPDTVHPRIPNLFYVGANTNPGIGMPMCLISAQLVYKRLMGDMSDGALLSL